MLRYFDTHGLRLAALPMGERRAGDPIILLHGVTHSVYFWAPDPLYAGLGPCWALSLPGHFPASTPADLLRPLTVEHLVEPLAAAIGQLCDRPATLIGLSTGGFAALALAARHPQLVRRVVSISGFARGRWIGSFGMLQALARGGPLGEAIFRGTAGMAGRSELAVRMIMATAGPGWNYAPLARYPYLDAVLSAMQPAIQSLDTDAMLAYFAAMPAIDIGPLLPSIAAPTLLIAGGRDPIVPTDESRRAAASIPNATLKIFPHAGHQPNFEHYPEFCQLLHAWLR